MHPQTSTQTCSPETTFSLLAHLNTGNITDSVPGLHGEQPGHICTENSARLALARITASAAAAALARDLIQPLGRRAEAQTSAPGLPADPHPPFSLSSPFSLPSFSTFHSSPLRDPSFHQQISVCLFLKFTLCVRHSARCRLQARRGFCPLNTASLVGAGCE